MSPDSLSSKGSKVEQALRDERFGDVYRDLLDQVEELTEALTRALDTRDDYGDGLRLAADRLEHAAEHRVEHEELYAWAKAARDAASPEGSNA